MWILSRFFSRLNERYHGPEGDAFAIEELTPVAERFLGAGNVLEVGCGYGRNLVALAATSAKLIVGCDVQQAELERAARERIAPLPEATRARVALVRQEPWRLPFASDCFDLVVLWQVLEHVFAPQEKQRVLDECARVLKSGGHLLVETPNQWFPVDYHDNRIPFAHWLLPTSGREWLTQMIRGKRYYPSQYLSLHGAERMLRRAPGVTSIARATQFYLAPSWEEAYRSVGGTQAGWKRLLFLQILPVHLAMRAFGSSADHFLPSIRMVWRIDKSGPVVRG
ncbi:MAG TPA: class I SAM-dependent methyltransferase [Candidatus Sulfotelmatobacter sp.]|nr:class I SAM-dependent methyltransferase [Candidatus Sulfotelmatobacter sp.]